MRTLANPERLKVFISYSHDSADHMQAVLTLARLLVLCGMEVSFDQWKNKRQDWNAWATGEILAADFCIVVASPEYKRAADGLGPSHLNRGAQSEAALLRDVLQENRALWTTKLLPVVLPGRAIEEIPYFLQPRNATYYEIQELSVTGIEELIRVMTDQPLHVPPTPGTVPYLPPAEDLSAATRLNILVGGHWPAQPTLELHLSPVSRPRRLTTKQLGSAAGQLGRLMQNGHSLNGAPRFEVGRSDEGAWVCSRAPDETSGFAVFHNGLRAAWTNPLRDGFGTILVETDISNRLSTLLKTVLTLDLPEPGEVLPEVRLAPLTMVRVGRMSDVDSLHATFPMMVPESVQFTLDKPWSFEDLDDAVADIAEELSAGLIRTFRKTIRRG